MEKISVLDALNLYLVEETSATEALDRFNGLTESADDSDAVDEAKLRDNPLSRLSKKRKVSAGEWARTKKVAMMVRKANRLKLSATERNARAKRMARFNKTGGKTATTKRKKEITMRLRHGK